MMRLKENGFAALEVLLIIVVLALVGFTGWYIWHAKQDADTTLQNANKAATSTPATTVKQDVVDTNSRLATFKSTSGVFNVQYPSAWVKPANPELCGDYLKMDLEIGPDAKSVIRCGADGTFSQVSVYYTTPEKAGDPAYSLQLKGYKDYTTGTFTANGVQGNTYSAVASGQDQGIGALPDGAILKIAVVKKANWVITATYTQFPATANEGPKADKQAEFDQIIKTIKFL